MGKVGTPTRACLMGPRAAKSLTVPSYRVQVCVPSEGSVGLGVSASADGRLHRKLSYSRQASRIRRSALRYAEGMGIPNSVLCSCCVINDGVAVRSQKQAQRPAWPYPISAVAAVSCQAKRQCCNPKRYVLRTECAGLPTVSSSHISR